MYFIVPEQNTQMIALMEKLKDEMGTLSKDRMYNIVGIFHF